jgi:hypothetical protein
VWAKGYPRRGCRPPQSHAPGHRQELPDLRTAADTAYTELLMFGECTTGGRQYVAAVRRYDDEIGSLERAAPRDLTCEVAVLQRTGLSVREHQRRTVDNFVELQMLWGDDNTSPFMPVIQGDRPGLLSSVLQGAQRRRPTTSNGGGNKHRVSPERACLYTTRRRKLAFCARSRRVTVRVRPTAGRCRVRASEARR